MTRTMKFGLGLISLQTHDEVKATHKDLYAQNIDYVKLAESLRFHSAWISEHHFLPDGYNPSSLVVAAALASATEKIRIGTAALLLPLHNPVRIAEDAAVVDNISNGRLDLGVAIGYRKEEYDGFGIPISQRPSRIEEGIEVLKEAWSEGPFSYQGKRYQFENIDVTPKPVQQPIPLYMGAFEEPAIRRAGRLGMPLLIGPGRTMDMAAYTLDMYNDEARQAGLDPAGVEHILIRECYVHTDPGTARENADRFIINMYKYYFTLGVKMYVRGQELIGLDDPLFEHLAEDRFIIGTPEDCVKEFEKYSEKLGINYFVCRMLFPNADYPTTKECIELFGKKVISKF